MQENKNIEDKPGEEISLLYYLVVILKHKKMIISVTLAFALITAVISLIMSPTYRAQTKILPPQVSSSGIAAQIASQVGSGVSGILRSSLGSSKNDQYVAMLKSDTMYDYIIDRFGLMESYKAKYRVIARTKLSHSVSIQNGKDEIITVSVDDKDPKRAADIANAFIVKLKDMTQTFAVTEASKTRLFFEEQLVKVKEDLTKSEDAMKNLQEKTGALDITEQAKAVIGSIADLRALIAAKEVEFKVMKTYTEPKNPDLQKTQDALNGMKGELQKLEAKSGENPDPLVSAGRIPQIGTDYERKLREVKYQETLFELLAKQYEIARVDEARDATVIQVLDKAAPPEMKAKPKRRIMVIIGTLVGLLIAIFIVFSMETFNNLLSDPQEKKNIEIIKDLLSFKKKNKTY
jgi:tyrosine-protein kinase Etk/Wzc